MASPAGFEPTAFRLGAHEACVKKARNIGKNVYYEKSVCATYAVDAANAAYAGKSVVKSVPKHKRSILFLLKAKYEEAASLLR